jgi:hypothetical protein
MVEVLISQSPSDWDMRGVFYLRSLGEVIRPVSARLNVIDPLRFVTFVYLFIILRFGGGVKPPVKRLCIYFDTSDFLAKFQFFYHKFWHMSIVDHDPKLIVFS